MVCDNNGGVAIIHGIDRALCKQRHRLIPGRFFFRASGGQRAFPIRTGNILGNLTVGDIIKLICCSSVVTCAGVILTINDGAVYCIFPAVNQVMGIVHQLDLVSPGIQNITPIGDIIIGSHILHGKLDAHSLAFARLQQLRLAKTGQYHMAFLNAAHRIRRGIINLYHIFARSVTRIRHLDIHGNGLVVSCIILDRLFKRGIGQAVAEGILHHSLVRILVTLAGSIINPPGFVETIAHVDAFCILKIVAILQVRIGEHARVPVSRRSGQVISIGICHTTGRVHFPGKHLTHSIHTGSAGRSNPECGINAFLFQESQFHGIGRVQKHNNFVEILRLDQLQQVFFILRQLQIMAAVVRLAITCRIHILGQIIALAAGTRNHHNSNAGILPRRCQKFVGVLFCRNLGRCKVCTAEASGFRPADARILIEVNQLLIDFETGIGQPLDQINIVGIIAGTTS